MGSGYSVEQEKAFEKYPEYFKRAIRDKNDYVVYRQVRDQLQKELNNDKK